MGSSKQENNLTTYQVKAVQQSAAFLRSL